MVLEKIRSRSSGHDAPAYDPRKPSVTSVLHGDVPNLEGLSPDEAALVALGYKQEFKREFSLWTTFCVSFAVLGLLPSVASTLYYGMGYAGTGGMVWGWLIAMVFIQCVAMNMAELCSSMPTRYVEDFFFSIAFYEKLGRGDGKRGCGVSHLVTSVDDKNILNLLPMRNYEISVSTPDPITTKISQNPQILTIFAISDSHHFKLKTNTSPAAVSTMQQQFSHHQDGAQWPPGSPDGRTGSHKSPALPLSTMRSQQ